MGGPPERAVDLLEQANRIALDRVRDEMIRRVRNESRADATESAASVVSRIFRREIPLIVTSLIDRAIGIIKRSVDEVVKRITRIDVTPNIGAHTIEAMRRQHVDLITDASVRQVERLEKILAANRNLHVGDLTEIIERETGRSHAKARLWARDQTLKLNAAITKEEHLSLGIEEYVWTTSNDERVRETHAEFANRTFRYDDPPEVDGRPVNPGEDYQCRCIAYPKTASRDILEGVETGDQRQSAPDLNVGELGYLRSGMRPESLDYAREQLFGGDVTERALAREPIIIDRWADGSQTLADGRHRIAAAQEMGAQALRATIRERGPRGGIRSTRTQPVRLR